MFADKIPKFRTKRERQYWIISFYESQIQSFLSNIGKETENGVKITSRLIKVTMERYTRLLEKYSATNW